MLALMLSDFTLFPFGFLFIKGNGLCKAYSITKENSVIHMLQKTYTRLFFLFPSIRGGSTMNCPPCWPPWVKGALAKGPVYVLRADGITCQALDLLGT